MQSFSKAAAELNVTQAGIAQHVRNLESEIGLALVTRQGRGIDITPDGQGLARSLADGFQTIAKGVDTVRTAQENRPLCVTTTPAFATHWLMPRIGDFWARHPDIAVTLATSLDVNDLQRDGIDLAIRYGGGDWAGLSSERLTDGNYWAVVRPDKIAGLTVTCLRDVRELPWLLETTFAERQRLVEDQGIDFGTLNLTLMHTNSLVIAGIKAGLGVSIQPESLVEQDVETGVLAKICELNHPSFGYHIVTPPGTQSNKVKTFVRWLKAQVP
ncbi:MAG: LysR family transcriptional regulator [Pseudomonadota bacterium]